MNPRSKKLSHHLARYLGSETAEEDVAHLAEVLRAVESDLIPSKTLETLGNLSAFLDIVDATYSKYEENLEVAERSISISSQELMEANRSIRSMVNSLGQGFLVFDREGLCSSVYSKACETLLETIPTGKKITDILRLDDEKKNKFSALLRLVFSETHAMAFEEIMRFAPQFYSHSKGAHIKLSYKPDELSDGNVDRVVLIATDVSEQVRAQELAEQRKTLFESIERIARDRQAFGVYIRRVTEMFEHFIDVGCDMPLDSLQREIHTLKGGAEMFRLRPLVNKLHDLETALHQLCANNSVLKDKDETRSNILLQHHAIIKLEVSFITKGVEDMLGISIANPQTQSCLDKKELYDFVGYLTGLGLTDVRTEFLRRICAKSLQNYLSRYNLVLSDLAANLNKKIKPIRFVGVDIPILIDPCAAFLESLVHIFRNIIDHGIEFPDERLENGKDETGTVEIETSLIQKGTNDTWVRLDIRDDGMGMNLNKIRKKLMEIEPAGKWDERGDEVVLESILTKNISTRDQVSVYSGRGNGLAAVYAEVMKKGGNMSITTMPEKGTTFRLEIPYRLECHEGRNFIPN